MFGIKLTHLHKNQYENMRLISDLVKMGKKLAKSISQVLRYIAGSVALLWHNAKVLALLKVKCEIN